uniref:SFRICE_006740 n=1 Tax=Spodoptera frugiperda TaxID=7108 RepID=A0A2H1VH27_SPOFR
MDDVFRDLEKRGKADVDNLIQWMKDSKLIEASKDSEAKVKQMFKERVELEQFKEVLEKLAKEQRRTVEQLSKQLAEEGPRFLDAAITGLQAFLLCYHCAMALPKDLTEAFTNLEKEMKTDVNTLVQWLKDSKLIPDTKEEIAKATELFASVADSKKVKLEEFLAVVGQLSANLAKPLEDLAKLLVGSPPASASAYSHNCLTRNSTSFKPC